jgi:hypothetical protein
VQHDVSVDPEHEAPAAVHAPVPPVPVPEPGVAQRRTPAASGTQGAPAQHWSRNWQTWPAWMQQLGVPS